MLSSHHQAVILEENSYRATAWSADGRIIEAIEHKNYPNVIGVQFHPEVDYIFDKEHRITLDAGEQSAVSFMDMYPGSMGKDFHYSFWQHIASLLP